MRVLLLSKYGRTGASSRLRSMQYIPYLTQHGVDVDISPLFNDAYLQALYTQGKRSLWYVFLGYLRRFLKLFQVFSYDAIWIEYEALPYLPAFFEKLLNFFSKPYLVDYDDAIFHHYDQSSNKSVRLLLNKKIDNVMKNAAIVVVGNQYLQSKAQAVGAKKIISLPTVIDLERYPMLESKKTNTITFGWIGSPATQHYIVALKGVFLELKKCLEFQLLLVGASPAVASELKGINVVIEPWSELTEVESLQTVDIGLMPLKDGFWEKGKCGYKLIQYMALAKPTVASPVGVNNELITSDNGFLAETDDQWLEALKVLGTDASLRKLMGENGRKLVEEKYTLQVQAPNLYQALLGCK